MDETTMDPGPRSGALAILGGSSAFIPGLAVALADAAEELPALDIRLHGRNEERLAAVAGFCNRYARYRNTPHEYTPALSILEAARGAQVIVNQMRIGGWPGRSFDETFPLAFGLPGDETIGPGGLASALRGTRPVLLAAEEAARAAAPGAWFINMTNPMGILVAALDRIAGIRCIGLCELPGRTLEKACAAAGCSVEDVKADYLGLNHQGWFVRLARNGRDLLPALFEALEKPGADPFFQVDVSVMRSLHALPLPYMRIYYHCARETERLRHRARSRGEELAELAGHIHAALDGRPSPETLDLLARRDLSWYRLALVPAVSALLGGPARVLHVTERNGGDIPGLPEKAVVEKRCFLGKSGARMIPFEGPGPRAGGPLEPFLSFLREVYRFEEAALQAALEPGQEAVTEALTLHPMGIQKELARSMAARILAAIGCIPPERAD